MNYSDIFLKKEKISTSIIIKKMIKQEKYVLIEYNYLFILSNVFYADSIVNSKMNNILDT